MVSSYLIDEKLSDVVEYSMKLRSFKIRILLTELPPDVAVALRVCTKVTSTVFSGKIGVRVRLLSAELLTSDSVTKLRKLTVSHKFSDWAERWYERKVMTLNSLVKEFRKEVFRYVSTVNPMQIHLIRWMLMRRVLTRIYQYAVTDMHIPIN